MIDKKIEEAARFDDKEYYDRLSDNDRCFFEYGFRRGYNRALKDLWHPAIEKPRRNTIYLAQIGNCAFDTFFDSKNWENFSKGNYITRWLYINDLFTKEGGEQ